jgi:DNA-binding helix-hairpin-helix protein with protein kinase domain
VKVIVKGQGAVDLGQQHFVATGGQASVYIRDGVAYKIYTDPSAAIPADKFHSLAAIQDPCVIKPSQLLLSPKNVAIGYSMDAVAESWSLCQLFTKAFRDREHVTNDHIVDLASKLRGHISNVHAAGVVIVDLNELNLLVSKAFDETYLIDVDSYQTKGYPATVIMPSVRDWSSKGFSELSDWFSYGVLAFQLFVGVHPYKGTHPASASVEQDKRLEHRMRNHISAFRSDVRLPKCCYSFDAIPQTFRDWLKAVLDEGKRVAPPDPKGGPVAAILTTAVRALTSSGVTPAGRSPPMSRVETLG